jgi:hypothetical protein
VHEGFYLRLALGPAAFRAKFARHPDAGGAALDIAAGGTLAKGLVLFGALDAIGSGNYEQTAAYMIGPGLAYWLLDANVYFAATAGVGRGSRVTATGDSVRTNPGFGLALMAGKEWLIEGGPLGLGVALLGRFSSFGAGTFSALALMFSATVH